MFRPSSSAASSAARQRLEVDTDVDERFSFVMKKDRMPDADMAFWLDRLKWKIPQWGKDHWLIRALRRGIGVHHENMPKQYVFDLMDFGFVYLLLAFFVGF
jgi:hypothetical protein